MFLRVEEELSFHASNRMKGSVSNKPFKIRLMTRRRSAGEENAGKSLILIMKSPSVSHYDASINICDL